VKVGSEKRAAWPVVIGVLASFVGAAVPLAACEARAPQAKIPMMAEKFKPQMAVLETLLFPQGQDQVVRFDEVIVGQGKALIRTKWDPGGHPATMGSYQIRTLLGDDFVEAGTGYARGRPANLVQLYAASLKPFAGHPELVLKTAFEGAAAEGEQLMVVEQPDCIVVASHKQGRISRMASVTIAESLNYIHGESDRGDALEARVEDCRTRTAAAAVGAWGAFYPPGSAVIQIDAWLAPATGPSLGLFEDEFAEALPKIEPGMSKQRFHELTSGGL